MHTMVYRQLVGWHLVCLNIFVIVFVCPSVTPHPLSPLLLPLCSNCAVLRVLM